MKKVSLLSVFMGIYVLLGCSSVFSEIKELPIEALLEPERPVSWAISPNGRYLVGQKTETEGDEVLCHLFCYDQEAGKIWSLMRGPGGAANFYFVSDEELLVRYAINGSLDRISIFKGGEHNLVVPGAASGETGAPLAFLMDARIVQNYLEESPGSMLVEWNNFGDYIGGRDEKRINGDKHPRGVYRVNTKTLEYELVAENRGEVLEYYYSSSFRPWAVSHCENVDYDKYGCIKNRDEVLKGKQLSLIVDGATAQGSLRSLLGDGDEGDDLGKIVWFDVDTREIYVIGKSISGEQALLACNVDTGDQTVIYEEAGKSVASVLKDPWRKRPIGVTLLGDPGTPVFIDPACRSAYEVLSGGFEGKRVSIITGDRKRANFVFSVESGGSPLSYYIYRSEAKQVEPLMDTQEHLKAYSFSEALELDFLSSDGEQLTGFFYPALGVDSNSGPAPLMVQVDSMREGGFRNEFSREAQFFCTRGYSVLRINHRSVECVSDKDGEYLEWWSPRVRQDIMDGINQLVADGRVDSKRVAIMGTGYGAYLAMMSMAQFPDRFQAGLCLDGQFSADDGFSSIVYKGEEHLEKSMRGMKVLNGMKDREKDGLFPQGQAGQIQGSVFIYAGDRKDGGRGRNAYAFHKALKKAGVNSVYSDAPIEEQMLAGRNFTFAYKKILEFLEECFPSD